MKKYKGVDSTILKIFRLIVARILLFSCDSTKKPTPTQIIIKPLSHFYGEYRILYTYAIDYHLETNLCTLAYDIQFRIHITSNVNDI